MNYQMRRICEQVLSVLQANTGYPISAPDLAETVGITYSQTVYAVHLLRRQFDLPVPICTVYGYGGGYILSSDDERVRPYRQGVMNDVRSRVVTFRANMAAYLATQIAAGGNEGRAAQLLALQLDRVVEDMGLLVPNGTP